MWGYVEEGVIRKTIKNPKPFNHPLTGTQYPSSIFKLWSVEELLVLGIYPYKRVGSKKNSRYWSNIETTTIEKDHILLTNTSKPKDLEKLKKEQRVQVNSSLHNQLLETDWMYVRSLETGKEPDTSIKEWRSSLRKIAEDAKQRISKVISVEELEKLLVVWPEDPRNSSNDEE